MPTIPASPPCPEYHLVSFDKDGAEVPENGGTFSEQMCTLLRHGGVTDVFLACHGWNNDRPAAEASYHSWIGTMAGRDQDRQRMADHRPGFKSLIIALHWPSLAWGNEQAEAVAFGEQLPPVADYTAAIAGTPAAAAAMETILSAAEKDLEPATLPPEVAAAFQTLYAEAGLTAEALAGEPGLDGDTFDPEALYQQCLSAQEAAADLEGTSYGGAIIGGLLAPLRILSFWTMKMRALTVGRGGATDLLRRLREAAGPEVRFHLMGHSFGCIVASAMAQTGGGADTLFLVQGALSTWSYCAEIPELGQPGHFHALVSRAMVRGAFVSVYSVHDRACRIYYPIGATFGPEDYRLDAGRPGRRSALGTFGAQGPDVAANVLEMLPADSDYSFQAGRRYNIDGQAYIRAMDLFAGAHNDIAHPEVAHTFWQAVLVAP